MVKNLPASAGDMRDLCSIPGSGRSPGGGHGDPLQYSCLKNPVDRGAWRATVHVVAKSQTQKQLSMHAYTTIHLYCIVHKVTIVDLRLYKTTLGLKIWNQESFLTI